MLSPRRLTRTQQEGSGYDPHFAVRRNSDVRRGHAHICGRTGGAWEISRHLVLFGYFSVVRANAALVRPVSRLRFCGCRARGMSGAAHTPVADFDADCRCGLDWLAKHEKVAPGKLGAMGFCIGGHLAFRAALQPDVRATVCFYGTGIHNGKLGQDADAGSLARAKEIRGELLMIFGSNDPHVPVDGRTKIYQELQDSGARHRVQTFPAEHAFMRDEGPRFDPEATDLAFAEMIGLFRKVF